MCTANSATGQVAAPAIDRATLAAEVKAEFLLMGLTDEAKATADLVATTLSFDADISVKNFEITIRI